MARRVVAIAADGVSPLDLGAIGEIFGIDRELGRRWYDLELCAETPGQITTRGGLRVQVRCGLDAVAEADTVLVLPVLAHVTEAPPAAVTQALAAAYTRGSRVASLCLGTFALAAAGLLDGLRATTHWRFCPVLEASFPEIDVVPEALFIDAGQILTSGGVAAGIDLCLHLVRLDHGADIANRLSRGLVTGPHRDGGQSQYIETPLPVRADNPIRELMHFALANLDQPLTLDILAQRGHMSTRTLSRQFRDAVGTTPHQWVIVQRLELARRLLETTDLNVDQVADAAGFNTALSLRNSFRDRIGVTPTAYRRRFSHDARPAATRDRAK